MKTKHLHPRLAVAAIAAGLAASGLSAATSPEASATPVTTPYSCLLSFAMPTEISPVTVDAALPATAIAGATAQPGWLSYNASIEVPASFQGVFDTIGATSLSATSLQIAIGKTVARTDGVWATRTPGALPTDPTRYSGMGTSRTFVLPAAGTYAVTMPSSFILGVLGAGGASQYDLMCKTSAPAQIGTITVTKQSTVTKVKAPKHAKAGTPVVLRGTVTRQLSSQGGPVPRGVLVAKEHGRTIASGKLDAAGKAKLKVTRLTVGTHSFVVRYKGDDYNAGSRSKRITLTAS